MKSWMTWSHSSLTAKMRFPGEFSSYALFLAQNCSAIGYCGAFIACKNLIVTAAHCLGLQHNYVMPYLQMDNYVKVLDEISSFNHTGKFIHPAIAVREVFVHPRYDAPTISYDVGVAILDCGINQTKYTKYSSYCACGEPKDGDLLTTSGFGLDQVQGYPDHLQKATLVRVTNTSYCGGNDTFCGIAPPGRNTSICHGDSGSCNPAYPQGFTIICHPELKYFIDYYVDKYCSDEPNPCAECSAPTNPCPLNYYEKPPQPDTTTTSPAN